MGFLQGQKVLFVVTACGWILIPVSAHVSEVWKKGSSFSSFRIVTLLSWKLKLRSWKDRFVSFSQHTVFVGRVSFKRSSYSQVLCFPSSRNVARNWTLAIRISCMVAVWRLTFPLVREWLRMEFLEGTWALSPGI